MPLQYIKTIKEALPKTASSDLKNFVDVFYSRASRDELRKMDVQAGCETGVLHFELSKKRKKDETIINIARPQDSKTDTFGDNTVIDIVQTDMAFIVDSVVAEIVRQKHAIDFLIHPMVKIKKTKSSIEASADIHESDGIIESHMHIQLHGVLTDLQVREIEDGIRNVLKDVSYATQDWLEMREKLREAQKSLVNAPKKYSDAAIEEYQAFLEYIYDNNFTLLGYREYKFSEKDKVVKSQTVKGKSLGLLHDEVTPVYINIARTGLSASQQKIRRDQDPITVSKANKRSSVHRRVPLDVVAVKVFDKNGKVTGEMMFIGLFTSVTYSRSIADIPFLRMKANAILSRAKFVPNSHDFKALKHILEKYPRDELFQISVDDLYTYAVSILRLQERPRIALYTRPDPFGRYISCLVYVPRERYETRLRLRFMDILEEELGGEATSFLVTQDDSPLSRVIFFVNVNHLDKMPKFDAAHIEQRLVDAGSLWSDKLKSALREQKKSEQRIAHVIQDFGSAFPVNYHERYSAQEATIDIEKIEDVLLHTIIALNLYKPDNCDSDKMRLRLYIADAPITLSDILPILENMGLKVLAELPFEVKPLNREGHEQSVWIHDFLLDIADKDHLIGLDEVKAPFEEALTTILDQKMENDTLNQLVLSAKMNWREITILRCYVRYIRQMGSTFSREYIEKALTTYPEIATAITGLFDAYFDPKSKTKAETAAAPFLKDIDQLMSNVASLDFDRILRLMTTLVNATLRTNFYQTDENKEPKPYLSIKLNSRSIEELPNPKPYREVFVYAPHMEGIHLRGDVIARGGIRWSDRHEDFRTEVLGLMKAQQVKNAVIVPMGAKGGFVVKNAHPEDGPAAIREEGIACYKTLVRGLLDITDNRDGTKIIPPKDVKRRDGDDPYLVVAADKGTATFSDIANALSVEHGFWLGDAFASGGSAGYDHKVMGITARGAWESVKRHFRELNHNTQTQDFDVIGIGDMGGDVFGNGMLLSEHICLVGAFNHMHIFCDPKPDTVSSFKERKRLFEAVKGWDHYDTKLLSAGGRIFNRRDKSLELTPEIKARFDIDKDKVTPNELIRAILRARTDLLWFGGIGTYVKSTKENHADVGDKGNDALRVEATELRAKVIGEGANLAITQLGRIQAAKNGVRLNADFIDNSAGVDSSDHEVNIKILLSDVMSKPKYKMDTKKRNKLLEKMTDSVAERVLHHNYQQVQGISKIEFKAAEDLSAHADLMKMLEKSIGLDRVIENLPNEEEIAERKHNGKGLTRPEISVLVSYAKIDLTRDLLKTDIPDSKAIEDWLFKYFPEELHKNFEKEILTHRLRRELIATMLASGIVNRMGPTFIIGRMDKYGASSSDIAKAYVITRKSFGLKPFWSRIEDLDNKVPAQVQVRAMSDVAQMTERAISWLLTRMAGRMNIEREIATFNDGIKTLQNDMEKLLSPSQLNDMEQVRNRGVSDGLPEDLARDMAIMPLLSSSLDIIRIANKQKADLKKTAKLYFSLGDHFHMDWMRQQARYLPTDNSWEADALSGLVDQLYACQAGITMQILRDMKEQTVKGNDILSVWMEKFGEQAKQIEPLFDDLRRANSLDLSMLVIAEQRLRNLYSS